MIIDDLLRVIEFYRGYQISYTIIIHYMQRGREIERERERERERQRQIKRERKIKEIEKSKRF